MDASLRHLRCVRRLAERLQCELGAAFDVRHAPRSELVCDGDFLTIGEVEGTGYLITVTPGEDANDTLMTLDARQPEPLREQLVAELRRVATVYSQMADDVAAGNLTPMSEWERAEYACDADEITDGLMAD